MAPKLFERNSIGHPNFLEENEWFLRRAGVNLPIYLTNEWIGSYTLKIVAWTLKSIAHYLRNLTYAWSGLCDGGTLVDVGKIPIHIVTNTLLVGYPALTEQQVYEFRGVHAGVLVGIGQNCCSKCHQHHFEDGILTQSGSFSKSTPPNITPDENGS